MVLEFEKKSSFTGERAFEMQEAAKKSVLSENITFSIKTLLNTTAKNKFHFGN